VTVVVDSNTDSESINTQKDTSTKEQVMGIRPQLILLTRRVLLVAQIITAYITASIGPRARTVLMKAKNFTEV
jgi:hypothetical protein